MALLNGRKALQLTGAFAVYTNTQDIQAAGRSAPAKEGRLNGIRGDYHREILTNEVLLLWKKKIVQFFLGYY